MFQDSLFGREFKNQYFISLLEGRDKAQFFISLPVGREFKAQNFISLLEGRNKAQYFTSLPVGRECKAQYFISLLEGRNKAQYFISLPVKRGFKVQCYIMLPVGICGSYMFHSSVNMQWSHGKHDQLNKQACKVQRSIYSFYCSYYLILKKVIE